MRLSGKKKRQLSREAKRLLKEKADMEGVCVTDDPQSSGAAVGSNNGPANNHTTPSMDTS